MTKWIDQENDPAPQWVGDMAVRESQYGNYYDPKNYGETLVTFKALCRRIYKHEARPVDPDFERMRSVASVMFFNMNCDGKANEILSGEHDDTIEIALQMWRVSS